MITCLMGLDFLTMDPSIWVAQKTGMPKLLHLAWGFSLVLDSLLILDLGDNPDILAFLMTVFALAALSHLCQTLCTCIWWTRHEHNVWFAFSFWLVDGPELESSIRERLEIILEVYVLKQLLMINSLSKNTLGRFQNNTYIEDVSNLIMALCVFCADTCRVTPNSRAQWIHSQLDDDKCVYFKE